MRQTVKKKEVLLVFTRSRLSSAHVMQKDMASKVGKRPNLVSKWAKRHSSGAVGTARYVLAPLVSAAFCRVTRTNDKMKTKNRGRIIENGKPAVDTEKQTEHRKPRQIEPKQSEPKRSEAN